MKTFLIIGMSTFGQHLCQELSRLGCEVMIADASEKVIEPMLPFCVNAKIGDCTNIEVLKSFGVDEFDACFVCLGGNFTEGLEISSQLKELGAKKVISEVNRYIERKFLLRNGADAVVYPEMDVARRVAGRESSDSIFDAVNLSDGYSVFEILPPQNWCGKSIKELNVRAKHNINIIAVKKENHIEPLLSPDYIFNPSEHLIVMSHDYVIRKLLK